MIFQGKARLKTVTTVRVAEPLNDVCFFLHNLTIARSFGLSQAPKMDSSNWRELCEEPLVCVCVCVDRLKRRKTSITIKLNFAGGQSSLMLLCPTKLCIKEGSQGWSPWCTCYMIEFDMVILLKQWSWGLVFLFSSCLLYNHAEWNIFFHDFGTWCFSLCTSVCVCVCWCYIDWRYLHTIDTEFSKAYILYSWPVKRLLFGFMPTSTQSFSAKVPRPPNVAFSCCSQQSEVVGIRFFIVRLYKCTEGRYPLVQNSGSIA